MESKWAVRQLPDFAAFDILSDGVEAASADNADVAQLAEQLFCKQPVAGSSPIVGSGRRFFSPDAWVWAVARVDNWAWL